jgi:hypothetical protein
VGLAVKMTKSSPVSQMLGVSCDPSGAASCVEGLEVRDEGTYSEEGVQQINVDTVKTASH